MKNLVVLFLESEWYSLNIDDFDDYTKSLNYNYHNIYITFQTSDLIREFNSRNVKSLPKIIDLESFDKQMSQEGKEFRNFKYWKVLNFLRYHGVIDADFKLTKENIKLFLEKIALSYSTLLDKDNIETKRYNDVEIRINGLIYKRQRLGVRINIDAAKQRCAEIEKEIYSIKNELQLRYKIFTPDNIESQKSYLEKNKYRIIKSLRYTFRIHSKADIISNLHYQLLRNQADLDSMLFIISHWGGQERTYPSFNGFGTITSRIVLRQPSLQNLRKTNRDIIIPDNSMKLLYIDYSQFEAGILASLGKDEKLIDLYNTDIYEDIAEKVLANKNDRKEAKILFYRYMYGDNTLSKEAKNYFIKFKKLEAFKAKIENTLIKNNKIGTKYGNYRYASKDDNTWALSHVVQSTASYIYKMALLEVQNEVKAAEFLIPMHDGTVYQINELEYDGAKMEIERIYKDVFKKICPEIEPKLTCSELFN